MSRQPPLPSGPPPRSNSNHQRADSRNSYRPYEQDRNDRDDYYSNRPRDGNGSSDSYRPSRNPPPPAMYEFRGEALRYETRSADDRRFAPRYNDHAPGTTSPRGYQNDSYRPREETSGFTFRQEAPQNVDFRAGDNYRRSPPPQRARHEDGRHPRTFNGNQAPRGRGGYRGRGRGRGGPYLASEREFLQGNRAPTPELMEGMEEDQNHGARYKDIDDLSDSDEAEMDLEDDEQEDDDDSNAPKKKQARTDGKAADGDSVPKWSNPDPYTALPCSEPEKKKDLVKAIRKARIAAALEGGNKTEAATEDFISFNDLEDEPYEPPPPDLPIVNNSYNAAPTDPRQPNLRNTQRQSHPVPPSPQGSLNQVMSNSFSSRDAARAMQDVRASLPPKPSFISQSAVNNGESVIDLTEDSPPTSRKPGLGRAPAAVENVQTDPALGSRKRNARDEIKAAPKIHETTRGKKGPSDGKIVQQWRARNGQSATPWVEIDHSDTTTMGFWLHKEIMDFYHFVKPQPFEQTIREKLILDLDSRVQHRYHDGQIFSFGSFPAGLYLPTADMDLVMVSRTFTESGRKVFASANSFFWKFKSFLETSDLVVQGSIDVISKARVPLVKYVDKITGLKVDISFENDTGLIANKTFQEWKTQYPAMPMLVTVIKHLLAMRGLNEPVNGGIGGFSVICLVVSLLQHMPQVQSRTMIPEHHLGEVLMEFFNLYGNDFNFVTTGIQLNPPAYFSKSHANVPYKGNVEKFMIIDPNKSDNDISGGSSNTSAILRCFSDCYRSLQETMAKLQYSPNRRNQSILGCILGGNYESFRLQREHLRHVHETLIGPVP